MGKIFKNGFRFWALGFGLLACGGLFGQGVDKNSTETSLPFETGFDISAGWFDWAPNGTTFQLGGGLTKGIDFFIDLPLSDKFSLQMGMGMADYQFGKNDEQGNFTIAKLKMYPRFLIPKWRLGLSLGGFLGFTNLKDAGQTNGFTLEEEGFTLGPIVDISHRIVSLKHLRVYISSKTAYAMSPVLNQTSANQIDPLKSIESVISLVFTYR